MMGRNMNKHHRFCCQAIRAGRVVLIYKGVTDPKPTQVRDENRLTLLDGEMYLDGRSCKGMTVALKP